MPSHEYKMGHYNQLKIDCESKGWVVHLLCVEVGCRGRAAFTFGNMCRALGFTKAEQREATYEAEYTVLCCSYAIVLARYQKVWQGKPLLDVSRWT